MLISTKMVHLCLYIENLKITKSCIGTSIAGNWSTIKDEKSRGKNGAVEYKRYVYCEILYEI